MRLLTTFFFLIVFSVSSAQEITEKLPARIDSNILVTNRLKPSKTVEISIKDDLLPRNTRIDNFESGIKVYRIPSWKTSRKPAYFVNNQFVEEGIISSLKIELIENFNIEKDSLLLDGKMYYGKILITMKENSNYWKNKTPNFVSLENLGNKYLKTHDTPTIYFIDDRLINEDYESYQIDENSILSITSELIDIKDGQINVVKILTKSDKNIKKSKTIRIRN